MFARLIGVVLLLSGTGISVSSIDPMAVCFTHCSTILALVELFGTSPVRIGSGVLLVALGLDLLLGSPESTRKASTK